MKTSYYTFLILAGVLFSFSACGGGTTEYEKEHYTGNPPKENRGKFIDSGVEGLQYKRPSGIDSLTKTGGSFYYRLGETINFHIGNLNLGTAFGLDTTTPQSIVAFSNQELNTSIYAPEVNNRVRTLMSLDEDNNPNNGIQISESTRNDAQIWTTPDFALDETDFNNDFFAATGRNITINKSQAESHFAASLRCSYSGAYRGYQLLPDGSEGPLVGVMIQAYDKNISKTTSPIVALSDGQDIDGDGIFDEFLYALGDHDMDTGSYTFNETFQFDKDAGRIIGSPLQNVTGDGESLGYNKVIGTFRQGGQAGSYVTFRVGEGKNSAYRYTGFGYQNPTAEDSLADPILGLFSFDIDTKGVIYGLIHDAQTNLEPELNGSIDFSTGVTQINLNLNGNDYILSGTIDVNTATVHLQWSDSDSNKLGFIDGLGCQLQPHE